MAEPKQKSAQLPAYISRVVPLWSTPTWLEAERWRRTVRQQPVAIICRDELIVHLQTCSWEIHARNPRDEDVYAEDIEYYKLVLDGGVDGTADDFDTLLEKIWQDALDLPVGGNTEITRWPSGDGPLSHPNPKGHAFKIVHLDGGTVYPTHDPTFPLMQRTKGQVTGAIYFTRNEIGRIVLSARPELERKGYGMAPPERVFLALSLLFRGDSYYANLLLDTPEAGLLDLMDMSKKSAGEWVGSFRELLAGIDPMKIGVLYEHTTPAQFISFGRPPTELMFNEVTTKYARITAAGYYLTLGDIGLEPAPGKTLAGQLREEAKARQSGFGMVKEKTKNFFNKEVLPPYLEFNWIERNEEALIRRYRAFNLATLAMKAAAEAGVMTARERQAQLVRDGLITIEVEPPQDGFPLFLPGGGSGSAQAAQQEREKTPTDEGGRGDIIVERAADLGDERISAAPKESDHYDQMAMTLREAFAKVMAQMGEPQLLKLVKATTRLLFPQDEEALKSLAVTEFPFWLGQRVNLWFGLPSEFDAFPDVVKASQEILDKIDGILESDQWWKIEENTTAGFQLVMELAFTEGATIAAEMVQQFLYTEGLADSPDLIGLNFQLTNEVTLAELEANAALLVRRVNDGTRYYLKRILVSTVEEGLSSPAIAQMIAGGEGVEAILREGGYTQGVIQNVADEIGTMTESRITSIVNTEIAKAETEGRVTEWAQVGLTQKQWLHTGPTSGDSCPCPVCQANIDRGFVTIDFMYDSVFGPSDIVGPPAHPTVCHCHIAFDENEVIKRAGELEVWMGD